MNLGIFDGNGPARARIVESLETGQVRPGDLEIKPIPRPSTLWTGARGPQEPSVWPTISPGLLCSDFRGEDQRAAWVSGLCLWAKGLSFIKAL